MVRRSAFIRPLMMGLLVVGLSGLNAQVWAQKARGGAPHAGAGRSAAPAIAPRSLFRAPTGPRATFRAPPQVRSMPAPRVHRQIQRQVPRMVVPQAQRRIQRPAQRALTPLIRRDNRQSTKRIVVPKTAPTVKPSIGPVAPRAAGRRLRALPSTAAALNPGLRVNPGFAKPLGIAHNASHRAGKAGWQHHHRPLIFKRGGHRWKRIYYTAPVAGLWYWYWYDVIADNDPAVVVYSEAVLPECYEDEDDCTGLETSVDFELIAPAILEGRATEDMMERCEDRYRSFERRTGTFTATTGEKRVCPYLL